MTTFWAKQEHLDEFQSRAVLGIDEAASFLVKGPAGSGKTNILLLRARWFRFKSLNEFKIIVFTGSLKKHVQEGCVDYGIPPDRVITCMQFFKELLGEYHIDFVEEGDFELDRAMLAGKVQSLIESKNVKPMYDALLVDESQDYMDTELRNLRKLARRLILVTDSRQSIYKTTHTLGLLESLVDDTVVELKYHYRSGLNLCIAADAILQDSANFESVRGGCKYDEITRPSSVKPFPCPDFSTQISRIIEKIRSQVDLYPDELIGVIFPKRDQVEKFTAAFYSDVSISDKSRIRIETMHGAKGLEFRVVHIGGCEALPRMGPTQKRLAYTSILRGRTAVMIYFTGSIPGYLENALARLEPPRPDPTMADLFVGGLDAS